MTPCQTYATNEGFEALDKLLFTTARRAEKGIALLCDKCPTESKAECGNRVESLTMIEVKPEGVFGGKFYA